MTTEHPNSFPGMWPASVAPGKSEEVTNMKTDPFAPAPSYGVPDGAPTNAPYTDENGNVWTYNSTTGQWQLDSLGPLASPFAPAGSSVVPAGTRTNAPYTDVNGNHWLYNPATREWQPTSMESSSPLAPAGSYGVPAGTRTNAPYTDGNGSVWTYSSATRQWQLTQGRSSLSRAVAATAQEIKDAEHYIFSLGHSHADAQKHAARIGHKKILQHQIDGENPLVEETKG